MQLTTPNHMFIPLSFSSNQAWHYVRCGGPFNKPRILVHQGERTPLAPHNKPLHLSPETSCILKEPSSTFLHLTYFSTPVCFFSHLYCCHMNPALPPRWRSLPPKWLFRSLSSHAAISRASSLANSVERMQTFPFCPSSPFPSPSLRIGTICECNRRYLDPLPIYILTNEACSFCPS